MISKVPVFAMNSSSTVDFVPVHARIDRVLKEIERLVGNYVVGTKSKILEQVLGVLTYENGFVFRFPQSQLSIHHILQRF